MITKASRSRYFYNVDGESETSKVLATSSVELVAVVLTAGGSSAAARIRNSGTVNGPANETFLIAANTGESTTLYLGRHLFAKGLTVVIEQGAAFGAEVAVFYD